MTTHPLTGKRYPKGFFEPFVVETLLMLVDIDISRPVIESWTPQQRHDSGDWALRTHLRASDNNYVRVPGKPGFLAAPDE